MRRVLSLRPKHQASQLEDKLRERGYEVVSVAAIEIVPPTDWAPMDAILSQVHQFDWVVFTSRNGVDAIVPRIADVSQLRNVAAIGPATRQALAEAGVETTFMPSVYTTKQMAVEFPPDSGRVLMIRAQGASEVLDLALLSHGHEVVRLDAYTSRPINQRAIRKAMNEGIDAVALTSASIVASFASAAESTGHRAEIFCIGPETFRACKQAGIEVTATAELHTAQGLAEAMEKHDKTRETTPSE
ncbi:MAG: uroporphyrinogen-III synthase [Actinomycetota bacterium]